MKAGQIDMERARPVDLTEHIGTAPSNNDNAGDEQAASEDRERVEAAKTDGMPQMAEADQQQNRHRP